MSKMNGKKENLEKKGAMNEIKENEMENVSGGYIGIDGKFVTAGYKKGIFKRGKAWAVSDTREGIEKEEKKLKKKGYTII